MSAGEPSAGASAPRGVSGVLDALRFGVWHVLAFLVVLLLPLQNRQGLPVWDAPPDLVVQAAIGGVGFLLAALLSALYRPRSVLLRLLGAVLATVAVFAVLGLELPRAIPGLPLSRSLLGVAAVLSLALVGYRALPAGAPALSLLVLLLPLGYALRAGRQVAAGEDFSVDSEFYLLRVRVHREALFAEDAVVWGGGLTPIGNDLLLATGSGNFARVRAGQDGAIEVDPLDVASPANRADFARDVGDVAPPSGFRIADVLAEPAGDSVVVYLSHHYWRADSQCFVLRVSVAVAHDDLARWSDWRTLFDAEPCLPIRKGERGVAFAGPGVGGRMLRVPEGLLVTVGDLMFDGLNSAMSVSQDSASQYGKTVILHDDGTVTMATTGMRNPQGLARDSAGNIWMTEHGPRGGDELNLYQMGANYGWPLRTLGTEYDMRKWPLQQPASAAFREPAFAFVPSVGVSNIFVPSGRMFGDWKGDLLIGSLVGNTLFRFRLDAGHPVYVEPIRMGFRLRDIAEAPDGSLVIWTDEGALLSVAVDDSDSSGAALIARCTSCHTLADQPGGLGPSLFRVVGRRVASDPVFPYSEALRNLGGRWTPERLDAFITNPAAFAPGTAMGFTGIADPAERALLIEYLRSPARRNTPTGG